MQEHNGTKQHSAWHTMLQTWQTAQQHIWRVSGPAPIGFLTRPLAPNTLRRGQSLSAQSTGVLQVSEAQSSVLLATGLSCTGCQVLADSPQYTELLLQACSTSIHSGQLMAYTPALAAAAEEQQVSQTTVLPA